MSISTAERMRRYRARKRLLAAWNHARSTGQDVPELLDLLGVTGIAVTESFGAARNADPRYEERVGVQP